MGYHRKTHAVLLCKSVVISIQWFQMPHIITFSTIYNLAVLFSGARVSQNLSLVLQLNVINGAAIRLISQIAWYIYMITLLTLDYLLQGTRRFGELGCKQWKVPRTRDSIYPILFSTCVHFRNFNISHI